MKIQYDLFRYVTHWRVHNVLSPLQNMKIKIIFFTFLLAGCFTKAQKTMPPPPPSFSFLEEDRIDNDFSKFSLSKRLDAYPFREAARIKLVSFNLNYDFEPPTIHLDSTEVIEEKEEILMSKVMKSGDFSKLDQMQDLNPDQIAKLSDILFNTCARHYITSSDQMGCYYPRNAILFLDKSNKIFEYFEVCFGCRGIETNKKFPLLDEYLCNFMYDDLERYFNELGIETKSRI